ncbi:hypothetical protein GY45DRAFT_1030598 [Cubamyces sp. BRFM 1775]|nr:hypothetical protein GY45DRAFT_1030598 [Cubamyces sp. BRFM 1775]
MLSPARSGAAQRASEKLAHLDQHASCRRRLATQLSSAGVQSPPAHKSVHVTRFDITVSRWPLAITRSTLPRSTPNAAARRRPVTEDNDPEPLAPRTTRLGSQFATASRTVAFWQMSASDDAMTLPDALKHGRESLGRSSALRPQVRPINSPGQTSPSQSQASNRSQASEKEGNSQHPSVRATSPCMTHRPS